MRERLDAVIGVLAIACVAFLVVTGQIAVVIVGFLLPFLMPLVLALLFAGGLVASLVNIARHWFGGS